MCLAVRYNGHGGRQSAVPRVSALTESLANPANYAAGGKEVAKITADLALAKSEAERLSARWEELERKQEKSR